MGLGWRVYGVGVMGLGVVCLTWRNLVLGQTLPKGIPGHVILLCGAGALMLVAGAAMEWRRSAAWGAMVLTVYTLVMLVVLNATGLLRHYRSFGAYYGVVEELAIAAGGLIIFAMSARIDGVQRLRLMRAGRMTFGMPRSRALGDGHFELRFDLGRLAQRITCFFPGEGRIVLLTVFRKQRQNERAEVARARLAMRVRVEQAHTADEEDE